MSVVVVVVVAVVVVVVVGTVGAETVVSFVVVVVVAVVGREMGCSAGKPGAETATAEASFVAAAASRGTRTPFSRFSRTLRECCYFVLFRSKGFFWVFVF